MLNEWIKIHNRLKEIPDFDFGDSVPEFNRCPKNKPAYLVYLDKNGNVEDVDIPDFEIDLIFRWQKGKKDPAFPVLNGRAFYEITCDESMIPVLISKALTGKSKRQGKKDKSNDVRDDIAEGPNLQEFLKLCNDLWEVDLRWIIRCLNELPNELQDVLENAPDKPGGYAAYKELVKRAGLCQPDEFRNQIRDILLRKLRNTGKEEFAKVLFAIKKEGKKKGRGREHQKNFLFLLTIKDWNMPEFGENSWPPYHHSLQSWMARAFEENRNKIKPIGIKDAFGFDKAGAEQNYDDVNAAGLGQIKLFAANEDIPCLTRYGLKSFDLFPAGRVARDMARKALAQYILTDERKGITWRSLKKYENRNTVAFAYCTKLKDANAIRVFDGDDEDDQENIYISEEATKAALQTFEGIATEEPAAEIVIGIIAAVDKGNTKMLASRHYKLTDYIDSAMRWQEGCFNIPYVFLPWLYNKDKVIKGALPIYPSRAVWLLNSAWRQDGDMIVRKQGNQKVPISKRFASSDALDFLFEKGQAIQTRVDVALENIIEKSAYALIQAKLKSVLDQYKKGDKLKFNDSPYIHMLPTLYGLILHKKGIIKEIYMNEDVFYLGRLFAVVDKLHIQYSLDIRDGDVPLRLIGNDHVSLALYNPLEAFVSMGRRMEHPYVSWAKRVKPDSIPRQAAKNCLEDIAELTGRLAKTQIPSEIDDTGKAKLILGYLSYRSKKEENETGNIKS